MRINFRERQVIFTQELLQTSVIGTGRLEDNQLNFKCAEPLDQRLVSFFVMGKLFGFTLEQYGIDLPLVPEGNGRLSAAT